MRKLLVLLFATILSANIASAQFTRAVVSLTGEVIDQSTRNAAKVTLVVHDAEGKKVRKVKSNESTGYYFITGLAPGSSYTIELLSEDYLNEKYLVNIPNTDRYAEFSRDFLAKPRVEGAKIKIPVPPFELRKARLRFGSEYFLGDYMNVMIANPDVKFSISCYPDSEGDPEINLELTEMRCRSLEEYFASGGVDPARISIDPHKQPDPANPPPTDKRAKGKRYIGPTYLVIEEIADDGRGMPSKD
ncbi:MAG: hypothetical protein ACLFQX_02500 [Candidatus Kapaibacterium sp.]